MNKNIVNIECKSDDSLLCKSKHGNYCITDYLFNILYESNIKVRQSDICSLSKSGKCFAVSHGKNIIVVDTKSDKNIGIKLYGDIFTFCFIDDNLLFYSEINETKGINNCYTFYIYDLNSAQRKILNKFEFLSMNDNCCYQNAFTAICETQTSNKIIVQKFDGESFECSLDKLVPSYISYTASFGNNGKNFLCLSRKNIFKKIYVYYVDFERGKSNVILSLKNKDFRGLPKWYILHFLNEKYFAIKSKKEINIYDFADRKVIKTYHTTDISVFPLFVKDSVLTFTNGESIKLQ